MCSTHPAWSLLSYVTQFYPWCHARAHKIIATPSTIHPPNPSPLCLHTAQETVNKQTSSETVSSILCLSHGLKWHYKFLLCFPLFLFLIFFPPFFLFHPFVLFNVFQCSNFPYKHWLCCVIHILTFNFKSVQNAFLKSLLIIGFPFTSFYYICYLSVEVTKLFILNSFQQS